MKTVISIPDPIYDAAERFARRVGVSRSRLYTRAITEYLEAHQKESVTVKLNEVYAEVPSGLNLSDCLFQYAALAKDEW